MDEIAYASDPAVPPREGEESVVAGQETVTSPADADLPRSIAPWWHTLAVLAVFGSWGALGSRRGHGYALTPRPLIYLSQMMITWLMFGSVVAGIRNRAAFFDSTLRHRAVAFVRETGRGLAIYIGFYIAAFVIVLTVMVPVKAWQSLHPQGKTPAASSRSADDASAGNNAQRPPNPLPPPVPEAPPRTSAQRLFDNKEVAMIAPHTALELLLWIGVSFTAAFCEEHIFRGYLLQQILGGLTRKGASLRLETILSIALTSIVFGSLHLYEGVGGALLITLLGAVYAVIALKLGNLRAVIAAHFFQDFVAGMFLFLFHSHSAR